MAQVRTNKLRPLAVTGAKRSAAAPEIPTMQEAGVRGYESATWYGIVAPVATPPDIVSRLNAEMVSAIRQPETQERLAKEGADPVVSSPQDFGRFIQNEIEKWRKVIRAAGIQPT